VQSLHHFPPWWSATAIRGSRYFLTVFACMTCARFPLWRTRGSLHYSIKCFCKSFMLSETLLGRVIQNVQVLCRNALQNPINKVRTTVALTDSKPKHQCQALREEKLAKNWSSAWPLALQVFFKSHTREVEATKQIMIAAAKLFRLWLYKTTSVHSLQPQSSNQTSFL
jgi:hypothetical protein